MYPYTIDSVNWKNRRTYTRMWGVWSTSYHYPSVNDKYLGVRLCLT